MEYVDLYFNMRNPVDLSEAASIVYDVLNISSFEERDSSNYVDDRYYAAEKDGVRYEIAYCDDDESNRFRFWMSLEKNGNHSSDLNLELMVRELVKSKFFPLDISAAQVLNLGKAEMQIIDI